MKLPDFFLVGLLIVSVSSPVAGSETAAPLTATEQWVVDQVSKGLVAELTERFPEEKDRQLSAKFLEGLLTNAVAGVKAHRNGVRIDGATIIGPVDLANEHFTSQIWLDHCRFMEPVTFRQASFTQLISFGDTVFTGEAQFNSITVKGDITLRGAVFEGSADFGMADISRALDANEAHFQDETKGASFNGIKVGYVAFFNNAWFKGPVNFAAANITANFEAIGAEFKNSEKLVTFNSVKIGSSAHFEGAVFEGPVDFITADIKQDFYAGDTQFKHNSAVAKFNAMKTGNAFFRRALFEADAGFAATDVPGTFDLDEAQFKKEGALVTFNSAKIGKGLFTRAVFNGTLDLRYCQFGNLRLEGGNWPRKPESFLVTGMTYNSIIAHDDEATSHTNLLGLVEKMHYAADLYGNLEAFFLRQGYRADANKAFIAGKQRERKTLEEPARLGSWLLDWLMGYGRYPHRAGVFSFGVVALGCFLFPSRKMVLQDPKELEKPEEMQPQYNRFWYSLGLFLPVVDLKTSQLWKPKKKYRFLRTYVRIHILLGWILVPIFLAAISGLVK
jgi:hypothetical protein